MSKSKADREREARDRAEREFMNMLEARRDGEWQCGIMSSDPGRRDVIFATADTEEEAQRYMQLRHDRNGGVIPHRLLDRVGWWRCDCATPLWWPRSNHVDEGDNYVAE